MSVAPAPCVLIADDEELLRKLATRVLERAGLRVETAATSDETLAALSRAAPPDALVLDFHLPPARGSDLIHKVCELAPQLPLILTSGDLLPPECKALLAPPRVVFLPKPLAPTALVDALQRALDAVGTERPRDDR